MSVRPWIAHYDEGVPPTLEPYPLHTLVDIARGRSAERPGKTAMHFKGGVLSWSRLESESDAFAAALMETGLKKGDRVALLLPNSPQMIIAEFGIWKAGGVAVPLNPLYTESELAFALRECGAETVVVLTSFYRKVLAVKAATDVRRVIASSIKEYLPPFKKLLFSLFMEKKDGHAVELDEGDFSFGDLVARYLGTDVTFPDVGPDDTALFLFSGGTTGIPKCAVCTHRGLVAAGMQIAAWFSVVLEKGRDIIMLNMPLFHVYAQVGILGSALVEGYPFSLVPNPRDLDDLLATIRKLRPSVLPGVPTLFTALIGHPSVRRNPKILSSLKLSVSAGAPLLRETRDRFEQLTGARIIDAYSLTEAMTGSVLTPIFGTCKDGSVGIAAPDVEIRIVDPDDRHREMALLQMGEVAIRAPQLMKEYWGRPCETARVLRDGWLFTGDLGYLDEDGYLFVVDRKKDVIKPSGFQVWPREVEEVIASHPRVSEVGVAGVPDDYQGEAVKAWVVPVEAEALPDENELRMFCREKLAPYKVPKFFEFAEALPKSLVGKVLRRKLVEEHCRRASGA